MKPDSNPDLRPWTRRHWIKQFMLGSAVALGASRAWRSTLLADISPDVPPTDIVPVSLAEFPDTPSIQLRLSVFDEIIMINRPGYNDSIYVLDARCTHQGCPVNKWMAGDGIVCPCHGSTYDVDGTLLAGAAGPGQGSLRKYNFSYDGVDLLRIEVPGLNLKINNIKLESATTTNKRIHLSFPGRAGSDYGVRYSPNLVTAAVPVLFATSATGQVTEARVSTLTGGPLDVWVDDPGQKGFYSIELLLDEVF